MVFFFIMVCFSSYASEIELDNLGFKGLAIKNNQNLEEDFFTRVANFESTLVMCDLLKYEDQEEEIFEIEYENKNQKVKKKRIKRTINGEEIENKEDIEDIHLTIWKFFKGQKDGKIVYGGACVKCKQEKWVISTSDKKKAKNILIADFANHNHKYCPNNPDAIRVKR